MHEIQRTSAPPRLIELVGDYSSRSVPPVMQHLVEALLRRHGDSVYAILSYGSCLRSGNYFDGLADLYVLVDSYRNAYRKPAQRFFNWLLPPNVFFLQVPVGDEVARAKYALLSVSDFRRGTSRQWFHSYLWSRFAQPAAVVFARDEQAARQVLAALAQAVVTFISRVLPQMPPTFDAPQLWRLGLSLTYQSELRVEQQQRTRGLVDASAGYYEGVTAATIPAIGYDVRIDASHSTQRYHLTIAGWQKRSNSAGWRLRRAQGKALSVLRLIKGLFTFDGGLDYIVWKLQRHSGTTIEIPARVRRYPLIFVWGLFWRLYRRGIFR